MSSLSLQFPNSPSLSQEKPIDYNHLKLQVVEEVVEKGFVGFVQFALGYWGNGHYRCIDGPGTSEQCKSLCDFLLEPTEAKGNHEWIRISIGELLLIKGRFRISTFRNTLKIIPSLVFSLGNGFSLLGFDHMFSSPLFLSLLALLAASLMACTYTTQIPLVKVARRWSFVHSAEAISKQEIAETLPRASVQDLGVILMGAGYEVFLKGPSLYAFKGLAGRFAPIGVHLAMLLIMAGGTLSAAGSFRGSVTVPQGLNFVVGDVLGPSGFLSTPTEAFGTEVHVNRFSMDYYDSGEVRQFHTDLSLLDLEGKEVMRKTISVNDPLRYGGITIYQTDWSLSTLQILKDDEGPFNLAMAPLKLNGDKKLFGTFLPVGNTDSPSVKGISMLARDLQSIVLYDQEGKFAGIRRPNSKLPIEIDGTKIVIVDAIGSTGLDLKIDPGVPVVYAGFGALMLTTCISFLSHAQIWALQDGTMVVVGGKTNRAKAEFPDEMNRLLDQVPEIVESSSSRQSDSSSG
ncbi:cytochrome c biogenesis protein family [Actinidia rufa]|uniref:Cytochrome c biogenesis protein family n=1 Tax=Actinidia rufa TaxID=165716 RepID=A0A7J0F8N2_9ERIC|nr:cytochrome c biogenesis protein family [Actinidia rufa]